MDTRIDTFIYRDEDGLRFANSLVLGPELRIEPTEGGIPELVGVGQPHGEVVVHPSGTGDDRPRIQAALDTPGVARVVLAAGYFSVGSPINVQRYQVLAGMGPRRTWLTTLPGFSDAVVNLGDTSSAVESLGINGGDVGIHGNGADLRVEGVLVHGAATGIDLTGERLSVRGSRVEMFTLRGVSMQSGKQASITDVDVEGTLAPGSVGIWLAALDGASVNGSMVRNAETGIGTLAGSGYGITGVWLNRCPKAVVASGTRRIALAGVTVHDCTRGFGFTTCTEVALTGCGVDTPEGYTLSLHACNDVAVNAFHAEMSLASTEPGVSVSGGSTLVVFTSIRRTGGVLLTPYELDVSGAGGRVLFLQQNFTSGKINSGGKYVAL
ncbi:MAG TPA: glycosyl hydrolase family 28-related protein [Longimicrobium sp.]|jgi:hypothetical protein